jgi:hypothetical protein
LSGNYLEHFGENDLGAVEKSDFDIRRFHHCLEIAVE